MRYTKWHRASGCSKMSFSSQNFWGFPASLSFSQLVKYLPICGATRLLCLWDFQLNTNTNTRLGEQYHLKLSLATYARPLDIGWEPPEYLMLVGSTLTWMLSLRLADETPNTSLPKTLVWVPQGHVIPNKLKKGLFMMPVCFRLSISFSRYMLPLRGPSN